jgi:hypothetical protein
MKKVKLTLFLLFSVFFISSCAITQQELWGNKYYKENINISLIRSKKKNNNNIIYNKNGSIYMKHNNYTNEIKYSGNNKKITINSNCRLIKYKRLINNIWYLIKLKKIYMSIYFYYTIYYIIYIYNNYIYSLKYYKYRRNNNWFIWYDIICSFYYKINLLIL